MILSNFIPKHFWRTPFLHPVVIFVLAISAYGNSFHHGFLIDDYKLLFDQNNLSTVSSATLIFEGDKGFYRPVGYSLVKLSLFLFGHNPVGYHVLNFVLFYTTCLLFYFLLENILKNNPLAFLASCFYAVHPINNILINYKSASMISAYILCMQMSTWGFVAFLKNKNKIGFIFSLIFYFLSLMSHEMGFILPFFLFFITLFFFKSSVKNGLADYFKLFFPYVIIFIIYFFIRSNVAGAIKIESIFSSNISLIQYLSCFLRLIFWYVSKLLCPTKIILLWDEPILNVPGSLVDFFGSLVIILIFILPWFIIRNKINSFGLVVLGTGFIPVLLAGFTYTMKMRTGIIEPHWLGFFSIGFFIVLGNLFLSLKKTLASPMWWTIVGCCMVFLIFLNRNSNGFWNTEEKYCNYWLEINSLNKVPWHGKALAYLREHDRGLEIQKYQNCIEVSKLAGAYHLLRDKKNAIDYYETALSLDVNCAPVYFGLGLLYTDLGYLKRADVYFDKAGSLDSQYALKHNFFKNTIQNKLKIEEIREIRKFIKQEIF